MTLADLAAFLVGAGIGTYFGMKILNSIQEAAADKKIQELRNKITQQSAENQQRKESYEDAKSKFNSRYNPGTKQ